MSITSCYHRHSTATQLATLYIPCGQLLNVRQITDESLQNCGNQTSTSRKGSCVWTWSDVWVCLTAIFPGGLGLAGTRTSPFCILLELRMMEVVSGDNWSYKSCKASVKSSPTNQHPFFLRRPDVLPVTQPTVDVL